MKVILGRTKSGKTTKLIERLNELINSGQKVLILSNDDSFEGYVRRGLVVNANVRYEYKDTFGDVKSIQNYLEFMIDNEPTYFSAIDCIAIDYVSHTEEEQLFYLSKCFDQQFIVVLQANKNLNSADDEQPIGEPVIYDIDIF